MTGYSEAQVIEFNERDVWPLYQEAGRPLDPIYPVWTARMQFDAARMGYAASRRKHRAELRSALGLPALPSVVTPHAPELVQCNFGSLWDPVLNRFIFQCMYPSMDADTRARWRAIARDAGDTHFQIGNPTTPHADYHIPAYTNWFLSGQMAHWNLCLQELVDDGFTPIVYADSGDSYPGAGYHLGFFRAIPDALKFDRNLMIALAGHEIVKGGYTTKQASDSIMEMDAADVPFIGIHLSDGRLSWSSHPVEADDPFQGDEIACYHGVAGKRITHIFYQTELVTDFARDLDDRVVGSVADSTHQAVSRWKGDHWVDPKGNESPSWGITDKHFVLWESNEELLFKGIQSREDILKIAATFLPYGCTGYGFGSPELLRSSV